MAARSLLTSGIHLKAFHAHRTGAGRLQAKEGPTGAAIRPAPSHRGVDRPRLRPVTVAARHTPLCFQPVIGAFV